ncbi:MAG: YraN family protein [Magnetococcales bacterium]|nr:YraN family protein [Magnetococcales bacterium]
MPSRRIETMHADPRRRFGNAAEGQAAQFMESQGYRIIGRNVRTRYGELDLVATQGGILVFCEVKARLSEGAGSPEEAISPAKQKKLAKLAAAFLWQHQEWSEAPCRFDAVFVRRDRQGWQIKLLEDAFRPGW